MAFLLPLVGLGGAAVGALGAKLAARKGNQKAQKASSEHSFAFQHLEELSVASEALDLVVDSLANELNDAPELVQQLEQACMERDEMQQTCSLLLSNLIVQLLVSNHYVKVEQRLTERVRLQEKKYETLRTKVSDVVQKWLDKQMPDTKAAEQLGALLETQIAVPAPTTAADIEGLHDEHGDQGMSSDLLTLQAAGPQSVQEYKERIRRLVTAAVESAGRNRAPAGLLQQNAPLGLNPSGLPRLQAAIAPAPATTTSAPRLPAALLQSPSKLAAHLLHAGPAAADHASSRTPQRDQQAATSVAPALTHAAAASSKPHTPGGLSTPHFAKLSASDAASGMPPKSSSATKAKGITFRYTAMQAPARLPGKLAFAENDLCTYLTTSPGLTLKSSSDATSIMDAVTQTRQQASYDDMRAASSGDIVTTSDQTRITLS